MTATAPGATPTPPPHPLTRAIDWDAVTREATDLLSRYVRIDSSHPAGRTTETAAFLQEQFATERIETRLYDTGVDGKVNLVARLRADGPVVGKPLLLSSHMDVVQAIASDWSFPPFSGEVADGYVYGRGSLDMKGMAMMELLTALLLRRHNVPLQRDVVLLSTCDEEVGSILGAKWMTEHHFADLDPAFVLDEGGSGRHGYYELGDAFEISVGEKRQLGLKLVARAEPGHGSQPWAEAATHRLVRAAHAILTQVAEEREFPPVAELLRRFGGASARQVVQSHRATQPMLRDTISLTMLSGGYKSNIIPETAEMHFDCRLLPDTDERAFVSNIEQLINDPGISVQVEWPNATAAIAPWDGGLYTALEHACLANAPGSAVAPAITVFATDARFFRQHGVPSYGLVPCILDETEAKRYHGVDERLSIANLKLGLQIIFDTTARVAARG